MKTRSIPAFYSCAVMPVMLAVCAVAGIAQARPVLSSQNRSLAGAEAVDESSGFPTESASGLAASSSLDSSLPNAPDAEPAPAAGVQHANVPWAEQIRQPPFSRMSVGADVSPLGIGIKSTILMTRYFDARGMVNFFNFDTGEFELEGFHVDAKVHLASAGALLDWYPFNSIWRFSAGALFMNGNQLTARSNIVPGTSFTLNGIKFYAANPNTVTGATPLSGTGVLGLHSTKPALVLSGGFGRFIPRSNRHWSFPAEFGVAFIGSPTINVSKSGWVCLDQEQTQCSSINSPTNPAAIAFNSALQTTLTRWRKDVSSFTIYPLFSYSVVYSFNIR